MEILSKLKQFKKLSLYNSIEIKRLDEQTEDKNSKIPLELLDRCAKMMAGFGFTINESKTLLSDFYNINKIDDSIFLVKNNI